MDYKPTVVFDFDGVIHSYTSGWKGAIEIPDPPVPGIREAIEQIRLAGYWVVVMSSRCMNPGGELAVRQYLLEYGIDVDDVTAMKPAAVCYIDDRAIWFDGNTETLIDKVVNFRTWQQFKDAPGAAMNRQRKNEKVTGEGLRPCRAISYKKEKAEDVLGYFHRWGVNYEEFETGPGNFTTAIIETFDGSVVSCPAETVQFLDREAP